MIIKVIRLKTSEDLDDTKEALVTITDMVVKEGNTDMFDKKSKI